jgi:16S rRNA (cytosine967-C5)-methyltransferase
MRRTSLIGHAIELLDLARSSRSPADALAAEFFRRRHYLGSRDRREIAEMFFGMLRAYGRLETLGRAAITLTDMPHLPAQVPAITLYALFALAVRNEDATSVFEETSSLMRLHASAVLPEKMFAAFTEVLALEESDPVARLSLFVSLPRFIIEEWTTRHGLEGTEQLCRALNAQAPVTVRVNTLFVTREQCRDAFQLEKISSAATSLSPLGLTLEKRVAAGTVGPFRHGWCELQDEGSQLIGLLVGARSGEKIVDACAGGGGKSLLMAATMENRGEILAIDNSERRLKDLPARARRAGVSIITPAMTEQSAETLAVWRRQADAVLVDAPCSGLGTLRRNPGIRLTLTRERVAELTQLQRTILEDAAGFVRQGGRLVYATCSLLKEENEAIVEWFLGRSPDFRILPAGPELAKQGISLNSADEYLNLLPSDHGTDGFFAALLTRT